METMNDSTESHLNRKREAMKNKTEFIAVNLLFVLLAAFSTIPALAQHTHRHEDASWKTGMLRIEDSVWAGNVQLRSGMYHVNHVIEGDQHWLVFKSVTLGAGYREGSMSEKKVVVRLQCRVEPVEQSVRNTKVIFGKTARGEKSIQEIQIAGEKVRHIVLSAF